MCTFLYQGISYVWKNAKRFFALEIWFYLCDIQYCNKKLLLDDNPGAHRFSYLVISDLVVLTLIAFHCSADNDTLTRLLMHLFAKYARETVLV